MAAMDSTGRHYLTSLFEPRSVAVIATPAATVADLIEERGNKGIRAALVITAGFRETGRDWIFQRGVPGRFQRYRLRGGH